MERETISLLGATIERLGRAGTRHGETIPVSVFRLVFFYPLL